jgi:hypothetical protein
MKLCKESVVGTLSEFIFDELDGDHSNFDAVTAKAGAEAARISALPDAVILASYFETKDWAQRVADGYTEKHNGG